MSSYRPFIGMVIFCGIGVVLPASLHAQTSTTVTLEQVLAVALEKSDPALDAQKKEDEREAEAREAATFDNPELKIDGERSNKLSGTGITAEVFQPIKLSHLTLGRSNYAAHLRQLGADEKKLAIFKATSDISAVYLKLWALQARKSLYEHSLTQAGYLDNTLRIGESEGQSPVSARQIFKADSGRVAAELKSVVADIYSAKQELSNLTGQSYSDAVLAKPPLGKIPATPEALFKYAQSHTTWRNVLQDRVAASDERLNVAQTDALMPEIGPRLVYRRNQDNSEETYGIGVQMRIPLWNQNDTERARANSENNYARTQNARYQNMSPEDSIRSLHQAALARMEYLKSLEQDVLPRYRKSYELTRTSLKQGQSNPLELWALREKLYQTEETAITATADAYLARLRLEAEIGGTLEEAQ